MAKNLLPAHTNFKRGTTSGGRRRGERSAAASTYAGCFALRAVFMQETTSACACSALIGEAPNSAR